MLVNLALQFFRTFYRQKPQNPLIKTAAAHRQLISRDTDMSGRAIRIAARTWEIVE